LPEIKTIKKPVEDLSFYRLFKDYEKI